MTDDSVHVDHVRVSPDWGVLFVDGTMEYSHHRVDVTDALRVLEGKTIGSWDSHYLDHLPRSDEIPIHEAIKHELYGESDE